MVFPIALCSLALGGTALFCAKRYADADNDIGDAPMWAGAFLMVLALLVAFLAGSLKL